MARLNVKPIVVCFVECEREVSYHANTVQELIDDMKQDYPNLTFIQADESNTQNIRGVFVDASLADMSCIKEDVNTDHILDHVYDAYMCDYNELANIDHSFLTI